MSVKRAFALLTIMLLGSGLATAQTEWVDYPDNPVIGFEDPGAWAPGGPGNAIVVIVGETYHMWFTGTDEGQYNEIGIGHATSPDSVEWTMDPANPVLNVGTDGEWDDHYLIGGAVIHDGTTFHMWYTGSSGEVEPEHIGYATSPDGSTWTKYADNPVMDAGPPGSWDSLWLGATAMIIDGGTYKMWYSGSPGNVTNTKIGYAESLDGLAWTKHPEPVLESGEYPGAWEVGVLNPSVVFDGTTYHMWYAGDYPTDYTKVGYAYSADGIVWTKHRDNPVHVNLGENIYQVSVLRDGTAWRMWYSTFEFPGFVCKVYLATSDRGPGVAALDNWQYIPAAAVASGAQGAFYQTDVDVNNADDQMVDYAFSWLPRGADNSEPTISEVFTLDAGMSARYTNVLTEVFGLEPDSFGALVIRSSSPDLLAMSRTYNLGTEKTGGTYGQAMPAIPPDDFLVQNETRRLLFGSEDADMRTNVGCQNGGLATAAVFLELFDSEGTSLARPYVMLQPLGNDQVNRIFDGYNPVNGYVEISSPSPNASYYCYGSVLDNTTSDPTTIPPQ